MVRHVKGAQRKEMQQWAIDEQKLDDARKLRGIYFVDPDDGEFKETIKNATKRLEIPMKAALPEKLKATKSSYRHRETDSGPDKIQKSRHACLIEAHEPTTKRLERTLSKDHEDHIADLGFSSLSHYTLGHKFVPMPQELKIPDAESAVDKEWEKLEKLPAWQLTRVKSKSEVTLEAQSDRKKVHFCYADGHLSKMRSWNKSIKSSKASLCSEVTL